MVRFTLLYVACSAAMRGLGGSPFTQCCYAVCGRLLECCAAMRGLSKTCQAVLLCAAWHVLHICITMIPVILAAGCDV
jgi:hypothetical protein